MLENTTLRGLPAAALVSLLLTATGAFAQVDPVGYDALLTSFTATFGAPGTGIVVEQNEAPTGSMGLSYSYAPYTGYSFLSGKTIINESSSGTLVSGHAGNVAQVFYGNLETISYGGQSVYIPSAYGVTTVDLFNADNWLGSGANTLNVASGSTPSALPANKPAVANFSWIGNPPDGGFGSALLDNDALCRFDVLIDQTNLVAVVAVNNGVSQIPALMASGYNSIAVGLGNSTATTSTGPVPNNGYVDGPGRSKPDVVAWDPTFDSYASFATPDVSSEATMLVQVSRSSTLAAAGGTNAAVIKAIIMASANKDPLPSWGHTSTAPLDPQWGAGDINFNWAYQIMTAGPQTASSTSLASSTGWSYSSVNPAASSGSSQTYYFQVPSGQPYDLSALLTWSRTASWATSSGGTLTYTPSLATIDLSLYSVNGNTLGSLLQSSSSSIDNVQYVFDRGLPAGEYALQVTRSRFALCSRPWKLRPGVADAKRSALGRHGQRKLELPGKLDHRVCA